MFIYKLATPKRIMITICLLFLLTRFYKIAEIPLSAYWDEASIGYNAYSISIDGKDEWGKLLPIHFRAFGEFKLPVYIYAVVPFVKLFGLSELSIRIPAVLFSLGTILISFLLTKRLTGNLSNALWTAFFITISPWFFIFSRTGYEVTAGLMFYLLAIYLMLSINNKWNLFLSVISFIISAYSYNSFRLLSPIAIIVLIVYQWNIIKKVYQYKLQLVLSLILILVSSIPIYRLYKFDAGTIRFQSVGNLQLTSVVKNYALHFSPDFLLGGDKNPRSQQPGFGQVYFIDIFLVLVGIFAALRRRNNNLFLVIVLLLLGPIPAAITKESPHALRSLSVVPFLYIISGFGLTFLFKNLLPKRFPQSISYMIAIISFLCLFGYYFSAFVTSYPLKSAPDWQYGYKAIFLDSKLQSSNPDEIFVSDEAGQPYIFALFYLRYDPQRFRKEVIRNNIDNWGHSTVKSFGKFKFFQ